jgi:hypothetical protein
MDAENIKNQEIKNHINMIYLHEENGNEEKIIKEREALKESLSKSTFISVKEDGKFVKIPYGLEDKYLIPIFLDLREFERGIEYFRLNEMDKNKEMTVETVDSYKKIKEDPNFLGFVVDIANLNYSIDTDLI